METLTNPAAATYELFSSVDVRTEKLFTSPFPVGVIGKEGELLGTGVLVGSIPGEREDCTPVIQIRDPEARDGVVDVLGSECYWRPLTEMTAQAINHLTVREGGGVVSALAYVQARRAQTVGAAVRVTIKP